MNKLLKTILVSAVMVTSGFASDETMKNTLSDGATLNVDGTAILNTDIDSVSGKLAINGGTFTNNALMKYATEGSLVITGYYAPGDLIGTVSSINDVATSNESDLTLNHFNKLNDSYWKFVSSDSTEYEIGKWSSTGGVSIKGGYFVNILPLTANVYNQAIQHVKSFDLSGCNVTIDWTDTTKTTAETGKFTQNDTARTEGTTSNYATCNPTQGVLDLTSASGSPAKFSGPISGGTVKLSHKTPGSFTSLSATGIIGVYEYDGSNDTLETDVDEESYIVPVGNVADPEGVKAEFIGKFTPGTKLTADEPNFYAFGDGEATDQRKNFEGLLADQTTLNKTDNKLATTVIATTNASAIKDVTEDAGVKVLVVESVTTDQTKEIKLNFEGADPLKFSAGSVTGTKVRFNGR